MIGYLKNGFLWKQYENAIKETILVALLLMMGSKKK